MLDATLDESALDLIARPPYGWAIAAVWGALWGSFFNVCIHRVGLYESVTRPRSRCPTCGHPISALENVPILSWLALGGRCRSCRSPISWRYPLVEALTAGLAVGVYARFVAGEPGDVVALVARFLVYFAFVGTLLVLSGIDLDHQLLPDRITYPAIPIFFVCALLLGDVAPRDVLIGAALGYALVAAVAELSYFLLGREGMGYGDAKLLMLIGALLGWRGVVVGFFAAPFLGLPVVLLIFLLRRKKVFGVAVPFGPFIAAAALIYLFLGRAVLGALAS